MEDTPTVHKINITTTIKIAQHASWPEQVPVTIYPPHYNLNDKAWLVYVRDNIGSYSIFIGQAVINAVRQDKRLAGYGGLLWRYVHYYSVVTKNGKPLFGDMFEREVADYQLFDTKKAAIENIRTVAIKKLEEDRNRHNKYLAVTEDALQRVKDANIELRYGAIE